MRRGIYQLHIAILSDLTYSESHRQFQNFSGIKMTIFLIMFFIVVLPSYIEKICTEDNGGAVVEK